MEEEDLIRKVVGDGRAVRPGAVVGSYRSGSRRVAMAGYADIENVSAIGERTTFHVASLAKQFTAFLVADLAARGRLDLDAPVGEVLGWLRPPTSLCTTRQLLFHTGGVRDHWALSEFAGLRDGDAITTADACEWIAAQTELNFEPGTRFLYSNSGYVLLARVVEALEGVPFVQAARRGIFEPLGMSASFFVDRPDATIADRARGYRPEGGGWARSEPNYGVIGATCLRTDVGDMVEWLSTPREAAFFAAVGAVGYFEPGRLADGAPIRYGFGQIHTRLGGRDVILHGGYDYGFNAISLRDPETGDALFAASNGSTPGIEGTAMAWFATWRDGDVAQATPTPPRASDDPGRPRSGVYARADLTDIRVVSEEAGRLSIFWNQEMNLEPADGDGWSIVGTPVVARRDGHALVFSGGVDEVRLEPVASEPFDPAHLAGRYISDALGSLMTISAEGHAAEVAIGRWGPFELVSVNADLLQFGANWMVVERDGARVTGLRLFQMRCAGVPFRPLAT